MSFAIVQSVHCQGCGVGKFLFPVLVGNYCMFLGNQLVLMEEHCKAKQVQGPRVGKTHWLCHPQTERDWSLPKGNGSVGAVRGPWGYYGCDVLHMVPTSQALDCSCHSGTACPTLLGSALGQESWRGI